MSYLTARTEVPCVMGTKTQTIQTYIPTAIYVNDQ